VAAAKPYQPLTLAGLSTLQAVSDDSRRWRLIAEEFCAAMAPAYDARVLVGLHQREDLGHLRVMPEGLLADVWINMGQPAQQGRERREGWCVWIEHVIARVADQSASGVGFGKILQPRYLQDGVTTVTG
jgi:hypothetical protein